MSLVRLKLARMNLAKRRHGFLAQLTSAGFETSLPLKFSGRVSSPLAKTTSHGRFDSGQCPR